MKPEVLATLIFFYHLVPICYGISSPPSTVRIGALFSFNSTIGRVAKVAIDAAVDDVNANPVILNGTKLIVQMQDSSCSGFIGIVNALQFMERDTVAIIGPQSSVVAHVISHAANEFQVPLLSFAATDPTLSSLQYPFFVRTTQNDLFQMAAIADIVDYYQWTQVVAIFTDDDYGRNGVASLGDKLAERRLKISYKAPLSPWASNSEIIDLLVKVELKASRIIILHVNREVGLSVFAAAKGLEMLSYGYVWIATDWLSSFLDSSSPLDLSVMDTIQGVLVLRHHTADSVSKNALTARWSQLIEKEKDKNFRLNSYGLYAYDTVFIIANALNAFFDSGGRISFSNDSNLHDSTGGGLHIEAMTVFNGGKLLLDQVLKTKFQGVTGLVQFDPDRNLIQPSYDILNVLGTGLRTIGYWSNSSGLSTLPSEKLDTVPANHSSTSQKLGAIIWPGDKAEKPRGWVFANNGKELRIGVPSRVSYREFVSKMPGSNTMKGYCVDVFSAAVNLLPYPVAYRLIPFGNDRENPSYTELVEMVESNEFDAAIGDIAIVTNRTKIVDFTQPYIESGLVILAKVNKRKSNAWAFLQPFTLGMWCVTGVSFLIVGFIIWMVEHRLNDEFRGPPKKQLGTIFWFSFSTLFFAHKQNTVSTMGRAILLIWLFVVLIIQSSYTASLTSILTVQQLSSPIKGIESLISGNEPIGFQVGSFTANYLADNLGIPRSRLKALGSPEEYARALELGPHNGGVAAVVDERPYIEMFLSKQCKFAIVGSEFTKSGWGFAFPRDSSLAVDMSTAILTLSENGDLQRIHDKWLARSLCSYGSSEIGAAKLPLDSFWGLFLICGMVCTLCLLIHLASMMHQFVRHYSFDEPDSSGDGSSRSGRSLQRFLSFIDEREEEIKKRFKTRMMQQTPSPHLSA